MNVLVTGGAGFIGSHMIQGLLEDPRINAIRILDSVITPELEEKAIAFRRLEIFRGSLLDESIRNRSTEGVHMVLHLAGRPSVQASVEDPVTAHLVGDHATLLLLETARRSGVKRFVFASSSAVYGDPIKLPCREDMRPNPMSPYAASKISGEYFASVYASCYGLDTVSLRYFNVYGPRQDASSSYSGVITRFCNAAIQGTSPVIYGDGEQTRDFIHVKDIVRANLLALFSKDPLRGRALNIGCGVSYSVRKVYRTLNQLVPSMKSPSVLPAKAGDVIHSQADISRARNVLGFEPSMDLLNGLNDTWRWYSAGHA